MKLNQFSIIFLGEIFLYTIVESVRTRNEACCSKCKKYAGATNFDYADNMMVNYYAPYPLRNSDVDLENTGERIQNILSESITATESVTVGHKTSSEKNQNGDSSPKIRMEDKLNILKALLLTDNSTEFVTKKSKLTTNSLLTVINFNTTINMISNEGTLKSQTRKNVSNHLRGEESITESVKDFTKHGGFISSKPGNIVDSNDVIKPAIFIALATKCEQIQNRLNNLEQLHKSLKSTNEDFSKEIRFLKKRLMEVEHRQLSEQAHVIPQRNVDSKLDEILKKLELIEHSQLMSKKPLMDSQELKVTKNISYPNFLLDHYRDALMRTKEDNELENIVQQYKERFEGLKNYQESGMTTTSRRVETFPLSSKNNTGQISNITVMKQELVKDGGFKTDINKLLTQITKVNQGSPSNSKGL